jgi:hypothetical protein
MHFAEPPADRSGDRGIVGKPVLALVSATLARRELFERAIELIERPAPGIS